MDNSTNNKNIFQSELPCEKKNGHSIIQEFINNYPYGVQDLIKLLECGYQITYEDRKIMKEQFPTDTYKYYATFSRQLPLRCPGLNKIARMWLSNYL